MKVSDLRVGGLSYLMTAHAVGGLWLAPAGRSRRFRVGDTATLLPLVEGLQQELRNPMAVARGRVPRLHAFMDDWGRAFLPRFVRDWPDVIVVTLHSDLHGLPLHLVAADDAGHPLGSRAGVTYASSISLLARCMARNPAREVDPAQWTFGDGGSALPVALGDTVVSGASDVLGELDARFDTWCSELSNLIPGEVFHFAASRYGFTRTGAKTVLRARDPAVLVIMAHGYVDTQDHRFSGLLLQRDPGVALRVIPLHGGRYFDFRDLPLRAFPETLIPSKEAELLTTAEMEIDLSLSARLVVLLGCSAGWGRVNRGDEPESLAETFLHVGACSVAAPLWDCDMAAAHTWSQAFLQAWVELGYPKALAARHALQQSITGPCQDNPEKWGVMALRGDWL